MHLDRTTQHGIGVGHRIALWLFLRLCRYGSRLRRGALLCPVFRFCGLYSGRGLHACRRYRLRLPLFLRLLRHGQGLLFAGDLLLRRCFFVLMRPDLRNVVVLFERILARGIDDLEHSLFLGELDLCFGRMHIDIHHV